MNHLAAHVAVDQLEHGPLPAPCVALLVSGGHSSLLLVRATCTAATSSRSARPSTTPPGRRSTRSRGCSACRSRAARTSTASAASGDPAYVEFPRGLTGPRDLREHRYDFSFSGLKTAVARWVETRERAGEPVPVADVAAAFQEAVVDVLTRKAVLACTEQGVDHLLIGGGVAANSRLRALAEERCAAAGIALRVPRPGLCTDNGAMVAALGSELVARGVDAVAAGPAGRLLDAGRAVTTLSPVA